RIQTFFLQLSDQGELVALGQGAPLIATQLAAQPGALTAHHGGEINAAIPGQITAHTIAPFPEAECFSCADNQGPAQGYRNAVERGAEICTGHGNDGGGIETQSGAKESDLQSGEITRIACDEIGQLMSAQVHGAAYGDA